MRLDSRLSAVLHALLHMAERPGPMTSEALAQCLGTHPVVVRRTMGLLRNAGLVAAERGHAGGWRIATDLSLVTLRDLHDALGTPTLFAVGHRSERPSCLVEQTVNAAIDKPLREAEALLMQRFAEVSLAQLAADFALRYQAHRNGAAA